ncbi:LysR family transcriptional regulator [Nocardia sp. CDC159]|uniref:LysR family transcriptional regulator n=1 Tax=Nocardia pulmonis TaxID=2951408 RepID=A0A9X2IZ65_9NOCA|nr:MULTISPECIES: LysR family transcriptional regulator [Nocardia]MCM6774626.1 LysR family transcriptional regulator [Nocardia pulmonis]MCM6787309.1 LysR family transcriptional regulator [Nocardia sp. CDC159]
MDNRRLSLEVVVADLDLAAVRAFVAVVDEGQFGHAADVLEISQQAVSKRIAKLENRFGVALLERGVGGVSATDAGKRLLPHARSLLAVAATAVSAVREEPRPLRVATQGDRQAETQTMRYYLERHPERDTEIVISNVFSTSRDALLGGRADAALARAYGGPQSFPPEIRAAPAYLEPLQLLVGKDHPLAGRSVVALDDVRRYPAWVPGASVPSEWADYYRQLSEFSGVAVETGQRPEPIEAVLSRVAASDILTSFTGEGFLTPWHPHIRRLPIVDPVPTYPHALLWSSANSHPGLPHLIDYFRENYNADIAPDCWIPEVDRRLFGP